MKMVSYETPDDEVLFVIGCFVTRHSRAADQASIIAAVRFAVV
jgi:hypothetical protein